MVDFRGHSVVLDEKKKNISYYFWNPTWGSGSKHADKPVVMERGFSEHTQRFKLGGKYQEW